MKQLSRVRQALPPRQDLSTQLRMTAPVLSVVTLLSLVAAAFVGFLHFQEDVSAYLLMDDPVALVVGLPPYTGLLSYAGVLAWCVSAAVSLLCGVLLWRNQRVGELAPFLLVAGGLSAWFTLDDLFILHEQGGALLFGFDAQHVGEALIFLAYIAMMATFLVRFRRTILRTDFLLLGVALISLGASVLLDVIFTLDVRGRNVVREAVTSRPWGGPVVDIGEELLKLHGLLLWCIYLVRVCFCGVRAAMRAESPPYQPHQKRARRAQPGAID